MSTPGNFVVDGNTGDVFTIPAPTSPSFIVVDELQLTVSATSTVTLKSGSETIDKAYLGTGNRYERKGQRAHAIVCNPGEAFVINNSAGTIAGGGTYHVVTVKTQTGGLG